MATIAKVPRVNGIAWKAIIKRRGRNLKSKTFQTKTAAREWARRMESDAELADALDDPGRRITLAELADRYLDQWQGRDHHRVSQVNWWRQRFSSHRLADIRPEDIRLTLREYAEGRDRVGTRPRAPATVNRMKAALSAMFSYAMREGLANRNPVRQVAGLSEQNKRTRYLSTEERKQLLTACRQSRWERLYLLVLMAMMTGARKGELKSLRWELIDLSRREARLSITKNGDPRVLTLPAPVIEELMKFRAREGLVFESQRRRGRPYDEKKVWQLALEQAGVENFRFHDLRHTAASYLAMGGATLLEIAEILGHRSLQTTQRYTHLSVQHKQRVTDEILGRIEL